MTEARARPRLVLASGNRGKLVELRRMLEGLQVEVVAMQDLGLPSPVEDGDTFEANALLKARAATIGTGLAAIADDSGLEVDALDGAPGVMSARFAGAHGDDRANNRRLLAELGGTQDRSARFVAAVAVVLPDEREWVVRGTMEGQILHAAEGSKGFGYDPLFRAQGQHVSNGMLAPEVKDRLSHRGAALRAIRPVLQQLFG